MDCGLQVCACCGLGGGCYLNPACAECGTTCVGDCFCGGCLTTGGTATCERCIISGGCPTLGVCCDRHICQPAGAGCCLKQTLPGNTEGIPACNGNIVLGDGTIIKADGTTILPCGTVLDCTGATCPDGCPSLDCCPCTGQKSSGVGGGSRGGGGTGGGGSSGRQQGSLTSPKQPRSGNQRQTVNVKGARGNPPITQGLGAQPSLAELTQLSPQMFSIIIIVLAVFLLSLAFGKREA